MKIRYEFLSGEIMEIEVTETMAELSKSIDRDILNRIMLDLLICRYDYRQDIQ